MIIVNTAVVDLLLSSTCLICMFNMVDFRTTMRNVDVSEQRETIISKMYVESE